MGIVLKGVQFMAKINLKAKLSSAVSYTKKHWSTPPDNRYMSIKEWLCYCLGGMGASTASLLPSILAFTAGIYIAVSLNINVWHITIISVVTNIISIVRAPVVASIIDNVNSKKFGKFRVYLVYLTLPMFLLTVAVAWVPSLITFNTPITNPDLTYILVIVSYTIFYNILLFVTQLYSTGFTTMQQVISPSPEERTNLMSFGVFVYSLGPSIFNAAFPFLANLLFSYDGKLANGINNIKTFLWIMPAFMALCLALGLLVAFGTKERMVLPKEQTLKIKATDGIKMVSKNKYFWLNLANNMLGTLPLMATSFTNMICTYMINNSVAQSIAVTVIGLAYNPGLLLAPIVIKKIGKKKLALFSNIFIAIATVPMIVLGFVATQNNAVWIGVLMIVINFLVIVCQSFRMVCTSAMSAQIYDYQQYRTGARIEGWLSQLGTMVVSAISIAVAFITPAVYSKFGYTSDPSVLYDVENSLGPIIGVMSIIGAATALLGAIPYFFWDLSEKRHLQIMDVLSVRAKKADGLCDEQTAAELEARIEAGEENVLDYFKDDEEESSENAEAIEGETAKTVENVEPVEGETAEAVESAEAIEGEAPAQDDTAKQPEQEQVNMPCESDEENNTSTPPAGDAPQEN